MKTAINVDFNYNVFVFMISIMGGYTPEQAFLKYENRSIELAYHENDTEDMLYMKETLDMSYAKIARIYNISPPAVYKRIKKYKEKTQEFKREKGKI